MFANLNTFVVCGCFVVVTIIIYIFKYREKNKAKFWDLNIVGI